MTSSTAASSNGRTPDFDSGNTGSSPEAASSDERLVREALIRLSDRPFDDMSIRATNAFNRLMQRVPDDKLWLWKNGDHYVAYDNLYPCVSANGDPLTLGDPVGYAVFKPSINGRPDEAQHG